jgi:threonyl-tRNA synthetase
MLNNAHILYIEFPRQPINIVLPDGKIKEGTSFVTTPLDVAKMLSNSLPDKVTVAKVKYSKRIATLDDGLVNPEDEEHGEEAGWSLWDSFRPLEGDCELKLLTFEDPDGKVAFWHSSAHILGETMEREFGV